MESETLSVTDIQCVASQTRRQAVCIYIRSFYVHTFLAYQHVCNYACALWQCVKRMESPWEPGALAIGWRKPGMRMESISPHPMAVLLRVAQG